MNDEKYKGLLKKYFAAESSLDDEENLFNAEDKGPGIEEWSRYVKQKKKTVPANFNDVVWDGIQIRKKRRQRFLIGLSGLAAAIAIFVSMFISNSANKNISRDEKEALLNEALSMFSEETQGPAKQRIIYEDDIIIIYTASK